MTLTQPMRAWIRGLVMGLVAMGAVGLIAQQPMNVLQINSVAPSMGNGTSGTGVQRVVIASDNTANSNPWLVSPGTAATWGVYVEDAGETAGGNLMMAGSVRRDAAAASAGTTGDNATLNTDALGLAWTRQLDPCSGVAKLYYPVNIVTATTTQIAANVSNEFYYICSINLFSAGTQNVALIEDDSAACASPPAGGGLAGGITAATGWNFTAQTGIVVGSGQGAVMKTNTANHYICFITSAAVQLSGTVVYVSAP